MEPISGEQQGHPRARRAAPTARAAARRLRAEPRGHFQLAVYRTQIIYIQIVTIAHVCSPGPITPKQAPKPAGQT